ncbi:MAG: hypothetical protein HPY64_08890 [Anaerolineae bacterium]|nr:hypothetical protein [Anaerolineae bacterium]
MNIKTGLRVLIALAVIVAVVYWAVDSTRSRTYTGDEISFNMGSGSVVISHSAEEAALARFSTTGVRGTFAIASNALEVSVSSTRQGTGASAVNTVELEVPPGTADVRVTRGTDVNLTLEGAKAATVIFTPQSEEATRTTYIAAAIVILVALFYISRTFNHGWIGWLRRRGQVKTIGDTEQAST